MNFGIATNIRSKVQECTPALMDETLDSAHVAGICAEIEDALEACRRGELTRDEYDTLKGELKKRLPIFTFHAIFKNGRRKNDEAIPSGLSIYDLDHIANPRARWEEIAPRKEELGIVMAHISPSLEGLRLVFTVPQGMTLAEAQAWMARQLGDTHYDACVKDYARCSFAVPRGYVLCLSEKLFEAESSESSENSEGSENSENSENSKSSKNSEYPETYDGIPYTEIVATLEEQMGGKPEHGSRNNFIFSMACHLRYVTNDDPEWIASILPTYGEGRDKWMATIRSACARSQTKTMPRIMRRTLAICKERLEDNSEFRIQNSELAPPPMPRRLPPLIKLLVSRTPRVYRAAVAHAVFPALGAHLWKTRFRYIDNVLHEATLMNVLVGETGAGKNCISEPINHILRDIRQRDMENLAREREWKREMVTKGANKDKRQRPEGLVIQEIDPDMTNAAFVQRLADAEERFLYTKMNEIDQFDALKTSARSKAHFQIMCLSFDPDNVYGQTRVGTSSVSERVCIRFNWNAATTIRKGQAYFQGVLTDGPISRINFCMIPPREIGSEMPVYGSYDAAFDEELRPYIECLTKARGTIECRQAMTLAKRLVEECAETARLSQNRVYENLSFRANVIAYLKAMVLYVAHGERWDKTMEEFVRWSLHYDLWCKMHLFGEAIEAQEEAGEKKKHKGPQNLLDLLPEVFTREEAGALRTRMGVRGGSLTHMLNNWKQRGYIELYGEEMTRDEAGRQRYIKTEEYLRRHGGKLRIES
ncbi:MAG: VirE protein [Bacteroidaceae bacterium]|nr:VirE protein [Bacteroidaceae bacterium]